MQSKNHSNSKVLVLVPLLAALVFIFSSFSIPIGDISRIHFGNIMCLLSGLLFGPMLGGLAAGFGSMLYDFTNPLYVPEFWITFLTKFAMGFMAGLCQKYVCKALLPKIRLFASATAAATLYIVLYGIKSALWQHFILGTVWPAVWPIVGAKLVASTLNASIAVLGSVLLALALRPALAAAGLFKEQGQNPA